MHNLKVSRWAVGFALLPLYLCASAQAPAPAPLSGPGLVFTYVEASPAKSAALAADLKAYATQLESGPDKPAVTILKELVRPSRMVVAEQWNDLSVPAFAQAAALLAARIQPDAQSPMDRRINHPLIPPRSLASAAFVVLMPLDIGGSRVGDSATKLQTEAEVVLAAPGAVSYEVAVQEPHPNHFAICEVWKSRSAYEAWAATQPAEDLRSYLAPLIGSPFDDRFYVP